MRKILKFLYRDHSYRPCNSTVAQFLYCVEWGVKLYSLTHSIHNSSQAHVRLRRCSANTEYLQHCGVYYCRQNDVTDIPCIARD